MSYIGFAPWRRSPNRQRGFSEARGGSYVAATSIPSVIRQACHTMTVNDPATAKDLVARGACGIISDQADVLLQGAVVS